MENCLKNALELNPRYLISGFKSQARNIASKEPRQVRQMACIMSAISQHTLKHGHYCYASDQRLLSFYNQFSASFGVKPIKSRTLTKRVAQAEADGLIRRDYRNNRDTGQTLRLISIVLTGLETIFRGVYNYAAGCAVKHHNRQESQKVRSGRSDLDNSLKTTDSKSFESKRPSKKCDQRSKDLSKERKKDKYNGKPSDSFYVKFFKQDANDAKSLQQAARERRLNASGAKKLIAIHARHGFELAKSFKRYLNSLLANEHSTAKWLSEVEQRTYGGTKQEALEEANRNMLDAVRDGIDSGTTIAFYDNHGRVHIREYWETIPTNEHLELGRARCVRDVFGRVQLEWLDASLWAD